MRILVTILLFLLWLLPAVMIYLQPNGLWGFLYFPITILSALWGQELVKPKK